MREYIVAVKALLRGEETSYQGNEFKAVWDHLDPGLAPPVYVACSGPRVIKMAAQVADGIIPEMGYTPEDIAYVYSLVEEGCAEIGRDPKEIDICWYSDVTFARDVETAMQSTIGTASHWLTMGSTKGKRIPEGYAPIIEELNADSFDLESAYKNPGRGRAMVERAKELGIYDWLAARSARLCGTPEDVGKRLHEFSAQGMENWYLWQDGGDHGRRQFAEMLGTASECERAQERGPRS